MFLLVDEILQASIMFGVIPSLIITLIIMYVIRKKHPDMTKKRQWLWFCLIFILSLFMVVVAIAFLFVLLMSGALQN